MRSSSPKKRESKLTHPKKVEGQMSDELVITVFKELAVLRGERTPDGRWTSDNPWVILKSLTDAIDIVNRAKVANQPS